MEIIGIGQQNPMLLLPNLHNRKGDEPIVRTGLGKSHVKRNNQLQILLQLRDNGPMSRVDLARQLNLTKAAISLLVGDLLEQGYLTELGQCIEEEVKPGKRKIALDINPDYGCTIGCVIDMAYIHAGAANIKGNVVYQQPSMPMRCTTKKEVFSELLEAILETAEALPNKHILGVGIGVNDDLSVILGKNNSWKWELENFLAQHCPYPVIIESSTRALAMAQFDYKKDAYWENLLFVEVSDALNMAFLMDGEPYLGSHSRAGDLKHCVVDPSGPLCSCGRRGCANALVSVRYVLNNIGPILNREEFPVLYDLVNGDPKQLNYDALVLAAHLGDPGATEIFTKADNLFFDCCVNLIYIFDPDVCYIHGLSIFAQESIDEYNHKLAKLLGKQSCSVFKLSGYGQQQSFLGGCAIAGRKFFYQAVSQLPEEND